MMLPPLTPNARLRWAIVERHLSTLPANPRILELGAGGGAAGARLAKMGAYVGVEPDQVSNETARSRLPPTAQMLLSIDDVADHDFDLLCSFEVLEHLGDDAGELRRWVSHLKPGGMVVVSVPAYRHRFAAADEEVGHLRRYDPVDLLELLGAADLVQIDVRAYGFPLGYPLEWTRNFLADRKARSTTDHESGLAERTATSGRLRQPSRWASPAIDVATWPFRVLQDLNPRRDLGTGLVGRAFVSS